MGFDDFFEQGHKRHKYGNDHNYEHHDENHDGYRDEHHSSHSYNQHNDVQKQIFEKLQNNPNLKKTVLVAGIIILVIVLLLVILLFPIIMKLLGFVTENGVQGLLDTVWKGTK